MKLQSVFCLLSLLTFYSCSRREKAAQMQLVPVRSQTEIIEHFTDSLHIGLSGYSKIVLIKHRVLNDKYVIVKLYSKENDAWFIENVWQYQCDVPADLRPEIIDYNDDGLSDLSFVSQDWMRGGNEFRRLFIYDSPNHTLRPIENAIGYSNIKPDSAHRWIASYRLRGGSESVFSRIRGDSLIDIARVISDAEGRSVYEMDNHGAPVLIRRDFIPLSETMIRYTNWNPLTPEEMVNTD